MQISYKDMVQTDNTYQTNWFDIYLTMLIVVNNNIKSYLIAQYLLKNKTVESYE